MKIKYTSQEAHIREMDAASFKTLGVENQNKVVWRQGEVQEVSDEAGEALLRVHGDEFEQVKDPDAEPGDIENPNQSNEPAGDEVQSLADAGDDDSIESSGLSPSGGGAPRGARSKGSGGRSAARST
jgi:hypothetical protein